MSNLVRVFVDTSALFSGIISTTGGAREILRLGEVGEIRVLISERVLMEANEKLRLKAPKVLPLLPLLLGRSGAEVVPVPPPDVVQLCKLLVPDPKDVDIVASAWAANVDYFVAFDRKHITENDQLRLTLPFPLGTPRDFFIWYRARISAT